MCCFFISQNIFAQANLAENDSVGSAELQIVDSEKTDNAIQVEARPVEAGAGGNIKLERKYRTKMESQFEWHTHLLWESRYVTEGRDNLSGNSLISVSSEFIIDEVNLIPWFAYSPAADYTERDLNIIWGGIGLTYLF